MTIKEGFKNWVSHSIRFGSCVFLREGGHDCPFINIRLLWKLDTFLLLLHSIEHMDTQHSATISQSKSLGNCTPFPSTLPSHGHLDQNLSLAAQQFTTLHCGCMDGQDGQAVLSFSSALLFLSFHYHFVIVSKLSKKT